MEWKDTPVWRWREHKPALAGITALVLLLSGGTLWFLLGADTGQTQYRQVAEFLTEDSVLGPFAYHNRLYVPINADWDMSESGVALGYLGHKEENCDSRFYRLAVANLLYRDRTIGNEYLQMQGSDFGSYIRIDKTGGAFRSDRVYLLWDEDWYSQTAYGNATGFTICSSELIAMLKWEYPSVEYHEEDFEDYDAYFTLRSYGDMKDAMENGDDVGEFEGCILVKDEKFYFGSYENPITGECLNELLAIVSGK